MSKTLASAFLHAWRNQKKTIAAQNLARQLDHDVKITKYEFPLGFVYDFSDGSQAQTMGKGRAFKIWKP